MRYVEPLTDIERVLFVQAARSLLTIRDGKPVTFRHQGRTLRGLDCIGALVWSLARVGRFVRDRVDYGRLPAMRKLVEALTDNFGLPVSEPMQTGDVVAQAWGDEEAHVAVVGDHPHGLSLIHCYANSGHMIEHRFDDHWRGLTTGVFRP